MPPLVNLSSLIDDAKCYELVRQHRWPEGVRCPHCDSASVARHGHDDTQRHLSNRQIARELDLSQSDVQRMTEQLRAGLVAKSPPARLEGEVEIDEVYVVAGHKGNLAAVAKRGDQGDTGG